MFMRHPICHREHAHSSRNVIFLADTLRVVFRRCAPFEPQALVWKQLNRLRVGCTKGCCLPNYETRESSSDAIDRPFGCAARAWRTLAHEFRTVTNTARHVTCHMRHLGR